MKKSLSPVNVCAETRTQIYQTLLQYWSQIMGARFIYSAQLTSATKVRLKSERFVDSLINYYVNLLGIVWLPGSKCLHCSQTSESDSASN